MTLQTYIAETGKDPVEIMNKLQDRGAISDNCVELSEVPDNDGEAAVRVLRSLEFIEDAGKSFEPTFFDF